MPPAQEPTARGVRIKTAADAHILLWAVHCGKLPMIHTRLDSSERNEVRPGAVFIWEERPAGGDANQANYATMNGLGGPAAVRGIERWTDGLKWGPSRVRDDFLYYMEREAPERSTPSTTAIPTPDYNNPLYRPPVAKPPNHLIKQTYSVHYRPDIETNPNQSGPARKWHVTAYHSHATLDSLRDVSEILEVQGIGQAPEGMFKKARVGKRPPSSSQRQSSINTQFPPQHNYPPTALTPNSASSAYLASPTSATHPHQPWNNPHLSPVATNGTRPPLPEQNRRGRPRSSGRLSPSRTSPYPSPYPSTAVRRARDNSSATSDSFYGSHPLGSTFDNNAYNHRYATTMDGGGYASNPDTLSSAESPDSNVGMNPAANGALSQSASASQGEMYNHHHQMYQHHQQHHNPHHQSHAIDDPVRDRQPQARDSNGGYGLAPALWSTSATSTTTSSPVMHHMPHSLGSTYENQQNASHWHGSSASGYTPDVNRNTAWQQPNVSPWARNSHQPHSVSMSPESSKLIMPNTTYRVPQSTSQTPYSQRPEHTPSAPTHQHAILTSGSTLTSHAHSTSAAPATGFNARYYGAGVPLATSTPLYGQPSHSHHQSHQHTPRSGSLHDHYSGSSYRGGGDGYGNTLRGAEDEKALADISRGASSDGSSS